jgi:hypothetical protein
VMKDASHRQGDLRMTERFHGDVLRPPPAERGRHLIVTVRMRAATKCNTRLLTNRRLV